MTITKQDDMPDIILFDEEKNWLFFVDAVTTDNKAMSSNRVYKLNDLTKNVTTGKFMFPHILISKLTRNSLKKLYGGPMYG